MNTSRDQMTLNLNTMVMAVARGARIREYPNESGPFNGSWPKSSHLGEGLSK